MNALVVNSSGRTATSTSRQLTAELVQHLTELHPGLHVTHRDVSTSLPFLNDLMISGYFTPEAQRTPEQQQTLAFSNQLVAELQAADVLVLGVPLYNFGIPAALKTYVDLVCRAGLTFQYTANGPEGLLKGKKAYIVFTSGGMAAGSAGEFATPHLRQVLGFIGITDVEVISAGQQSIRGEAPLLDARAAIQQVQPVAA